MLKFEVSCDIGGYEDIRQLAAGHEELWYEVDVPVVDAAILLPRFLPLVIVAVLLEELLNVREGLQTRWVILTVSILTEAASLLLVSGGHKIAA